MMKPAPNNYPAYYHSYISLVQQHQISEALEQSGHQVAADFLAIDPQKHDYRYAPDKWSVKQLLGHIIDTERILAYRALRFARQDPQQPLSFDENAYALHNDGTHRNLPDMVHEFKAQRASTVCLFNSFTGPQLQLSGQTAAGAISVLALGFVICGHALHHHNVLQQKYLSNSPSPLK